MREAGCPSEATAAPVERYTTAPRPNLPAGLVPVEGRFDTYTANRFTTPKPPTRGRREVGGVRTC